MDAWTTDAPPLGRRPRPRIPEPPSAWWAAFQAVAVCVVVGLVGGLAMGAVLSRLLELALGRLVT